MQLENLFRQVTDSVRDYAQAVMINEIEKTKESQNKEIRMKIRFEAILEQAFMAMYDKGRNSK